jgi:adenine-specific DNA-methyltransferase
MWRTVPIWVKQGINAWMTAAGIEDGRLLRSVSKSGKVNRDTLSDWTVWSIVEQSSKQIGIEHFGAHDLRRTRVIFVWFIKQRGLVPDDFFGRASLHRLLIEDPYAHPDAHGYYLSILQNLFFACLNTEVTEREWLPRTPSGSSSGYLVHNKLRQKSAFANPDVATNLFKDVPFLNGGLFDCLDEELEEDDSRAEKATPEGRGRKPVLRVDGFSEDPARQPRLPNRLFFGGLANVDLSDYYGKPTRRTVKGLIDLFDSYKLTIEENTPLEEEAVLDPELLGKVFENLLASYNDDTKTTARNKSGSFYTPREVVDFMVDQALVPYLAPFLGSRLEAADLAANESKLRRLLSYTEEEPGFTDEECEALIKAIEECKAIDPAVGSGAFPLGLLQKLVHVLHRLDPNNVKWKARNRSALELYRREAEDLPSFANREEQIADADRKLNDFDASFVAGTADYARKLYLIEGCLYGVDSRHYIRKMIRSWSSRASEPFLPNRCTNNPRTNPIR